MSSPIQNLPPELISHIAEMCTWNCDAISESHYPSYARYHAALARTNRYFHHTLNYALYKRNLRHDPPIHSCVLWAVRNGRLETLKKAHSYGADLEMDGKTEPPLHWSFRMVITAPLHIALYHRHSHIVEYLLESGVNVHIPSSNLCHCLGRHKPVYPLHTALAHGVMEDVEKLIHHGAYLAADNNCAIFDVDERGRPDLVNILLERDDPFSLSANLRFAAAKQDVVLARRLLAYPEIDVNAIDWRMQTALYFAVASTKDDTRLVELLLQHPELDLSSIDRHRRSTVHHAAAHGNRAVVELFINHPRVPPAVQGCNGEYPLHLGAQSGDKRVVELLLKQPGASIHHVDGDGRTVLHYAYESFHSREGLELAQFFIEEGLSINHLAVDGTVLTYAARASRLDVMSTLLTLGSDPSVTHNLRNDLAGWNYLHYVLWKPNTFQASLTKEFIARGANVNEEAVTEDDHLHPTDGFCRSGQPLFFAAVGAKSLECMKLLLEAGARINPSVRVFDRGKRRTGPVPYESLLSGIFRHLWGDGAYTTDDDLESAMDRINLLVDHGTPLGKLYRGRATAMEFVCSAARRGKPQLLRHLSTKVSTRNTEIPHLDELITFHEGLDQRDPDYREIVTLLKNAKERVSSEISRSIKELNTSSAEENLG